MLRLNLGCWQFGIQDWLNVDINPRYGTEHWDVITPPYASNTVDEIYAGHLLEHFTAEQTHSALTNWHNILKPGSKLTIAVPDFEKAFILYQNGELEIPELNDIIFGDIAGGYEPNTHKQLVSEELLLNMLSNYKFKAITVLEESPLCVANPKWQTIVEAIK